MQAEWPDGTLAGIYALRPVSAVTTAAGVDDVPADVLVAAARFVVPYGGLKRGRLMPARPSSSPVRPAPMAPLQC